MTVNQSLTLDAWVDWQYPLTYKWFKNGVELAETGSALSFPNIMLDDYGYYKCERKCGTWEAVETICFYVAVNEQSSSNTNQKSYPNDQLVIWYDETATEAYKDSMRQALRDEGAFLKKSCLCNIELWDDVPQNIVDTAGVKQPAQDTLDEDGRNFFIEIPRPTYCISNYQLRTERLPDSISGPKNVIVGILDTGFDISYPTIDPFLWDNTNEPDTCCTASDPHGYNTIDSCGLVIDNQGHGTAVGGLIANYSPSNMDMDLMNIKIINNHGGNLFDLICGGYFAINNGAKVINMSFGYYGERSNLLERLVRYAKQRNVLLVTAAGNEGTGQSDHWPSGFAVFPGYDHIIRVGAEDGERQPLEFSSDADLYALGHQLISPAPGGIETLKSGTSFATSFVTSTAATILSEENLLPHQVITRLKSGDYSTINPDNGLRFLTVKRIPYDENYNLVVIPEDITISTPLDTVATFDANNAILAYSDIWSESVVNFRARTEMHFTPGFHALPGSVFNARIEPCDAGPDTIDTARKATGIAEQPTTKSPQVQAIDTVFRLSPNQDFLVQPNPFSGQTTLHFSLEKSAWVSLVVHNALGQQVAILANERMESGPHRFVFSAGDLPAGVYYATLMRGEQVLSRKLVMNR